MSLSDRLANSLGLDDFGKRHKIAFVLLCVAMIAITTLWVMQFRRNISDPLHPQTAANQTQNQVATEYGQNEAELRAKDTDNDGLNDWDELNLYKTSPYLADTDSDTFTDKQEVESGNNPNCPQGQSCAASTDASQQAGSSLENPTLTNLLDQQAGVSPTATASVTPTATGSTSLSTEEKDALRKAIGDNPDPAALRQFLSQAGMDKKTLDSLTDQQLLKAFSELGN